MSGQSDPDSFLSLPGDLAGGLLIVADHASNRVPAPYGDLGLPLDQFQRHIAYDIGIAPLARHLAAALGAPAVLSTFSRLVIDPNRGADDPTLVMRLSDGAVVPGNARVDDAERQARIDRFWVPYHGEIDRQLDAMLATGTVPFLLSLHSFTPVWRGRPRPWHVGILWDRDPRLPELLLSGFRAETDIVTGDNEPYDGALQGDCMYLHGTRRGLAHAIIELRQDLIGDDAGVAAWGDRIARLLTAIRDRAELHEIHHFGSRTGPVVPL